AASSKPNSAIAQNANKKVPADSVKIETVKALDQSATTVAHKVEPAQETKENGKVVFYTVKKNDSLWKIAQKYEGVSAKDIQTENNIESNRGLKVGQKLKITIN
ncbi:LysM peptidoglycan-binding domain-containing protein, partial [Alistipes sp. ZOR0009]|uniref:LysM peptidoglycan-binding domain-containing protein n=1 Tax=Alistipes sp. ZOR0009 TaxID=1339253 RepID=UPI000648F844